MKQIDTYIVEKLKKINSKNTGQTYNYFPKNRNELATIVYNLIKERGIKANLNDIDTSKITDMSVIFYNSNFNGDISEWDVSNVKNMRSMFNHSKFTGENGDISKWDVSNVQTMNYMFDHSKFKGDISKWDVSNVRQMVYMFDNSPLEKNPPKWYQE